MKVPISLLLFFARLVTVIEAFTASSSPPGRHHLQHRWFASTQEEGATTAVKTPKSKTQQLGLLTFDLDDTLYPIELVVRAANGTSNFGGWVVGLAVATCHSMLFLLSGPLSFCHQCVWFRYVYTSLHISSSTNQCTF